MKYINNTDKSLIQFYSNKLNNIKIQQILKKDSIETESEAKEMLEFLDKMGDCVVVDEKNGVSVIDNETVHISDVIEIFSAFHDYIEELGYGHLIDDEN